MKFREDTRRLSAGIQTGHSLAWINTTTHVCSWWRSIALADCSLWTNPTVYLGLKWFQEILRRSGGSMLSLSGRECGFDLNHTPTRQYMLDLVIGIVKSQRRRIRCIQLESRRGAPLLFTALDVLQEFKLDTDYAGVIFPTGTLNLFGERAPCLRTLYIRHASAALPTT